MDRVRSALAIIAIVAVIIIVMFNITVFTIAMPSHSTAAPTPVSVHKHQ